MLNIMLSMIKQAYQHKKAMEDEMFQKYMDHCVVLI